ncbi:MAG: hypothetical protein AOA65_0767 [Candidatus Bathyarchaeota archaeon BA1]|nr:MAG: hypothetical protein AOA65_0767 [Candidatus Bathyarchaeota archaeon BA1]
MSEARIKELLDDAEEMYRAALEELGRWEKGELGRFREGAEKAWCATFRAIAALTLGRMKIEPSSTREARIMLTKMAETYPEVKDRKLLERYMTREVALHGACFYGNYCEPIEENERRIKETKNLIDDIREILK